MTLEGSSISYSAKKLVETEQDAIPLYYGFVRISDLFNDKKAAYGRKYICVEM